MSAIAPVGTTSAAATSSHAAFAATRVFGGLDGLRALSITWVLWHHTYEVPTAWKATERGFLGVDLFFVISGFLIVTLLLRERDRRGDISLRDFYVRRFLRIFPVYYGLLFGLTLVYLTVGRHASTRDAFFSDLPWALAYLSNWVSLQTFLTITWSLSAEEQFYLLWPPLQQLGRRLGTSWVWPVLGVLLAVSQAIHFGLVDPLFARLGLSPGEPAMLKQTGFTPILLGVGLAHLLHAPGSHAVVARVVGGRFAPIVALALLAAVASVPGDDITGWPRLSMHLVMTALVAAVVIRENHALMPALRLAPVVRVGALSYGMYLFHMLCRDPVQRLLARLDLADAHALFFLGTFLLTVLVAELSFRFYESRFLALKHRFSR
jgi:peptidoglycan/LPS O-acetylase OafA/YrhL